MSRDAHGRQLGSALAGAERMARGDAEEFANEQSGIFEIAALPPRRQQSEPDPDRSAAIIGLLLVSALYGTVTLIAYWQAVAP
jgi:hypothetical protein